MRSFLVPALAILGVMALAGCASNGNRPAAPEPVKPIDAGRFYQGRWYEIGRTPMTLTDGCVAGTTDYYRDDKGRLIEDDACRMDTPEGAEKRYKGPVTFLDPASGTKVSVRYTVWGFIPVWRTYWMLDRGEAYDWFIVSDPELETVSLFTRSPRPASDTVEMMRRRTRELGYDPAKLEFPAQFPEGER